jgi:hypothetical protein
MRSISSGSWWFSALALATACKAAQEEVTIVFPDQRALDSTNVVAFTAFEPIIVAPESEGVPTFVTCKDIGVFPPVRVVDPDTISTFPNLGRVLTERESQPFPFDGSWSVGFDEEDLTDETNNPWGAVMIYLEARGEVRAPDEQGGGQISATLLSACYCVRTKDGSHKDRRLDQEVKTACPMLGGEDGTKTERTLSLAEVVTPEFHLEPCAVTELTSPKNQSVSPGPLVCVETIRCDDAPLAKDCFQCQQPCDELNDMKNVPILFTVNQAQGTSSPASQVVLTDGVGQARGVLAVDDCANPITVTAQVVGRQAEPVSFTVQCIDRVAKFNCGNEKRLLRSKEPQNMSILPGAGQRDFVAILHDDGSSSYLTVVNPIVSGTEDQERFVYDGEVARGVHGFYYDVGNRQRPLLAVATSLADALRLRIYEWDGTDLSPHDGLEGLIAEDCRHWQCGGLTACTMDSECPGPMPPSLGQACDLDFGRCTDIPSMTSRIVTDECHLKVEFQTEISMSSHDVDADGFADLAVATNSDVPITTYYSSRRVANALYSAQGCTCGQWAQAASTFELIDFGGAGAPSIDLIIGAPGGAFVKYAQDVDGPSTSLTCGGPGRFGDLVPVRDVAKGYFQCNPRETACPYQDIVVVAAKSLGGGSFDDPGKIQVIYGFDGDLSEIEDLTTAIGTNVELVPRKLAMQGDPRDPRTAQVADFNGDTHDDLAVLFGSSEEVHVWLGVSNKGLGEVENGVILAACELAVTEDPKCNPLRDFAVPDFDGDGKAEVAVVCKQGADARLRWYTPETD